MQTYRRKPTTVQAERWDGSVHPLVSFEAGNASVFGKQGWSMIYVGDWIIAEIDGSGHYPINPEVFAQTYEAVAPFQDVAIVPTYTNNEA